MVAVAVSLSTAAAAEPALDRPVHMVTPGTLTAESGATMAVPPGYFLTEPLWNAIDVEVRRLQDVETRLGAENLSLRKSADEPRVWPYLTGAAVGVALGIVAGWSAFH